MFDTGWVESIFLTMKSSSELDKFFCKSVVLDWVRSWCRLEGQSVQSHNWWRFLGGPVGPLWKELPSWFASCCSRNHLWSFWQSISTLAFRICGFWLWAELKRLLNVLFYKAPQTEHFIFSVLYLWTFLFVPKFACFSLGKNTNRSVCQNFYLIGTIGSIRLGNLFQILFFIFFFMHMPRCLHKAKMNWKKIAVLFHVVNTVLSCKGSDICSNLSQIFNSIRINKKHPHY